MQIIIYLILVLMIVRMFLMSKRTNKSKKLIDVVNSVGDKECAGQGMRASANAILVFKESHFFLIRMVFHEERIDTAFSSGKTAAAGHGGVDLILGNEMLDGWHLGKVRRKSSAWQVKILQVLPDFPWPMVMKAQQVTVLLIGSPEGSVFFLEGLAESRFTQLLRQTAGLLWESIAFDL